MSFHFFHRYIALLPRVVLSAGHSSYRWTSSFLWSSLEARAEVDLRCPRRFRCRPSLWHSPRSRRTRLASSSRSAASVPFSASARHATGPRSRWEESAPSLSAAFLAAASSFAGAALQYVFFLSHMRCLISSSLPSCSTRGYARPRRRSDHAGCSGRGTAEQIFSAHQGLTNLGSR